jgi:hypothetical protein
MDAKLINGGVALITPEYDEFGEFHRTERMISTETAVKLSVQLLSAAFWASEEKKNRLINACEKIDLFFQSGNGIQVERATIQASDWSVVKAALKAAREE